MQLNNNDGNLTDKADIPNIFIQKCKIISYKGGLFPVDNSLVIETISICAI